MDTSIVLQGVIVGLILAVPVGPLALICIRRTLSDGRAHGLLSGIGITAADSVYAAIAFLGLTAISSIIMSQELLLRIFAGLVLIVVGLRIIMFLPDNQEEKGGHRDYLHDFISTFALALANPMTLIFLMVTLPGYGFVFGGTSLLSAGWFVGGFFAGSVAWWALLCGVVGAVRSRLTRFHLVLVNHVSGIFIAGVGMLMLAGPVMTFAGITLL